VRWLQFLESLLTDAYPSGLKWILTESDDSSLKVGTFGHVWLRILLTWL
jgi:hypothetical protein